MINNANVPSNLSGRLAEVERRRLERENRRLARQVEEQTDEMARLRAIQQLDSQLLERERTLRADILGEVRRLLSDPQPKRVEAFLVANPPPTDAIPSFLRSAEAPYTDSGKEGGLPPALAQRLTARLSRYLKKQPAVQDGAG